MTWPVEPEGGPRELGGEQHAPALAIAGDIGVPFEQARALEGPGQAHLHDGNRGPAIPQLGQAPSIYQRVGAHAAPKTAKVSGL